MIVSKNGVELRNLEEQVLKNKEDIAAHYNIDRVLADFGIRVVGQVTSATYLPDPSTFSGEYGDAYAVGTTAPYYFYIWTRADVDSGHPEDYWFNIGSLAIVGPQGPQGEQGIQGIQGVRGSIWVSATSTVPVVTNYNVGDQFLLTSNGNVYECSLSSDGVTKVWTLTGNIRGPQGIQGIQGIQGETGPQGPQGIQGPRGDVGGFINIAGILSAENQLPTPAELGNLTKAYLVGTATPYDLYVQIGDTTETATWNNVGPLNVATLVTVGGEFQNIWDADTKVDKPATPSTASVLTMNTSGVVSTAYYSTAATSWAFPRRDTNGDIAVPDTPSAETSAVNKGYADANYVAKVTPTSGVELYYATNSGQQSYNIGTDGILGFSGNSPKSLGYATAAQSATLALRDGSGQILVGDPTNEKSATNKGYVDDNIYRHTKIEVALDVTATDISSVSFIINTNMSKSDADSIVGIESLYTWLNSNGYINESSGMSYRGEDDRGTRILGIVYVDGGVMYILDDTSGTVFTADVQGGITATVTTTRY